MEMRVCDREGHVAEKNLSRQRLQVKWSVELVILEIVQCEQ